MDRPIGLGFSRPITEWPTEAQRQRDAYLELCTLEDEELHAIVKAGTAAAKDAQNILDNRAESAGVAEEERRFREYWEGGETREDRDRQDLRDAGRSW